MDCGNLAQSSATAATPHASSRELPALGLRIFFFACANYPLTFSNAHTADRKLSPVCVTRRSVRTATRYRVIKDVLAASAIAIHTCADF
mmetsp:Transcript_29964/g.62916  ORF Transcript_29964/g.62916 Transcript_29964/m.62916 type:complete len:89 (-) Transcript_29964:527-793(-)